MAEALSRTFERKTPATLAELRNFITQATSQGFPDEADVEVLTNFKRGIINIAVKK